MYHISIAKLPNSHVFSTSNTKIPISSQLTLTTKLAISQQNGQVFMVNGNGQLFQLQDNSLHRLGQLQLASKAAIKSIFAVDKYIVIQDSDSALSLFDPVTGNWTALHPSEEILRL